MSTDKDISISEQAITNMENMFNRVIDIGSNFGFHSDEYVDASQSLNRSLLQVFRLGGRIIAEDKLGLYGSSFIEYGVVFHRKDQDSIAGTWSVHS